MAVGLEDLLDKIWFGAQNTVEKSSSFEHLIASYLQTAPEFADRSDNDPNDWSREVEDPRYIIDRLARIVTLSLETMKIVDALPPLAIKETQLLSKHGSSVLVATASGMCGLWTTAGPAEDGRRFPISRMPGPGLTSKRSSPQLSARSRRGSSPPTRASCTPFVIAWRSGTS